MNERAPSLDAGGIGPAARDLYRVAYIHAGASRSDGIPVPPAERMACLRESVSRRAGADAVRLLAVLGMAERDAMAGAPPRW
jgi:hypothetical protein